MVMHPNNLGEVTAGKMAMGSVIIVGAVAGLALTGVVSSFYQEVFVGMKRGISYKEVARRNAMLGGAIGAVAVAGIMVA